MFFKNFSSFSFGSPPGLKIKAGFTVMSITVDSTPMSQEPESIITSTLPSISSMTCSASVGLGFPDRLAEGAAIGVFASLIKANATL